MDDRSCSSLRYLEKRLQLLDTPDGAPGGITRAYVPDGRASTMHEADLQVRSNLASTRYRPKPRALCAMVRASGVVAFRNRLRSEQKSSAMTVVRVAATVIFMLGLGAVSAAAQPSASTAEQITMRVPPTGARVCLGWQQGQTPAPQSCTASGPLTLVPKQDGMLRAGRPDYETVAGQPLSSCVRDRVSGLVWEGKPDSGRPAFIRRPIGPPDLGYSSLVNTYGPHNQPTPGSRANTDAYSYYGDGRPGDAMAYVAQVNTMRLCGFTDWRLPTVAELQGLIGMDELINVLADKRPAEAAVDVQWFPNTVSGNYMTSEPADMTRMWCVSFDSGSVNRCHRRMTSDTAPLFVRLVRGPEAPEAGRYRAVADERGVPGGVVEDRHTGLVWRRCQEPQVWSGQRCIGMPVRYRYLRALVDASAQPGWRLPTIKEVNSLAERWFNIVNIPAADFPASGTSPLHEGYWTSTVCNGGSETRDSSSWVRVWVLWRDGNTTCEPLVLNLEVRLVRE
ncbi:hypothetical protein CP336_21600 [Pseudomonas fluorescens]|nr:hypothetical protein CP336_21600 [Pseudomonas fluorescens]